MTNETTLTKEILIKIINKYLDIADTVESKQIWFRDRSIHMILDRVGIIQSRLLRASKEYNFDSVSLRDTNITTWIENIDNKTRTILNIDLLNGSIVISQNIYDNEGKQIQKYSIIENFIPIIQTKKIEENKTDEETENKAKSKMDEEAENIDPANLTFNKLADDIDRFMNSKVKVPDRIRHTSSDKYSDTLIAIFLCTVKYMRVHSSGNDFTDRFIDTITDSLISHFKVAMNESLYWLMQVILIDMGINKDILRKIYSDTLSKCIKNDVGCDVMYLALIQTCTLFINSDIIMTDFSRKIIENLVNKAIDNVRNDKTYDNLELFQLLGLCTSNVCELNI